MKYVTGIERRAMERGIAQGVEQGIAQGVQQGLERGMERGLEQGLEQGRALMLKRLLSRAFGEIPPDVEGRLATASRDEIDRWADRVFDAGSLDEVFGSE